MIKKKYRIITNNYILNNKNDITIFPMIRDHLNDRKMNLMYVIRIVILGVFFFLYFINNIRLYPVSYCYIMISQDRRF